MATINRAFRVKNGLNVEGAELRPALNTTSYPAILFLSTFGGNNAALLTTPTAGAMEYDGTRFYLSPSTTRKAIALTDSTGATLDSTITGSSLTSVGTLTNLSVTNTITGSINGNAATVTNGVYTTGTYANPAWITSLAWSKISTTPTTLSGYGITDAATSTHVHGNITNDGKVGSTANLVLVTGASGAVTVAATPSSASTQFLRGDLTWVVPTDTNFYPTAVTMTAGTTAGPTVDLTMSGTSNITGAAIPSASATASGVITTGAQTLAGVKTFNSSPIVPDPTNDTDAANKRYVDSIAGGVDWKASVKYATTGALGTSGNILGNAGTTTYSNGTSGVGATITLSTSSPWSSITIDGQSLTVGDRVLIKDQATGLQNGIYTVTQVGTTANTTSFVFTRATDADTTAKFTAGLATFIETGTANADTGYINTTDGAVTMGTTAVTFTQFTGLGQVTVNSPLTKSGNAISLGTVGVGNGGTGQTTLTSNGVLLGNGASAINATVAGTADQVLRVPGAGGAPAFGAIDLSKAAAVTGTLGVGNGGTGITSFGTGVATALGVNVGSSGAFVTNGGALGTPSSGTLTNATGLPIAGLVASTSTAIGVGSVELGHATDTTISRVSAGVVAIEGVNVVTVSSSDTLTNKTLTSPALNGTPTIGGNGALVSASTSTTGTTPITISSVYDRTVYAGGEFIVRATNGTNVEICKFLVITNGTDAYISRYGEVWISADLFDADFTYSTNNVNIVLTPVAGTTGTTTFKVIGTLIGV